MAFRRMTLRGVFLKQVIEIAETGRKPTRHGCPRKCRAGVLSRALAIADCRSRRTGPRPSANSLSPLLKRRAQGCAIRESIPAAEMLGWNVPDGEGILPRSAKDVQSGPVTELGLAIVALMSRQFARAASGYGLGFMAGRRVAPPLECAVVGAPSGAPDRGAKIPRAFPTPNKAIPFNLSALRRSFSELASFSSAHPYTR